MLCLQAYVVDKKLQPVSPSRDPVCIGFRPRVTWLVRRGRVHLRNRVRQETGTPGSDKSKIIQLASRNGVQFREPS